MNKYKSASSKYVLPNAIVWWSVLGISGLKKTKQALLEETNLGGPWASPDILAGYANIERPWSFLAQAVSHGCDAVSNLQKAPFREEVKSPSGTGAALVEKRWIPKLRGKFLSCRKICLLVQWSAVLLTIPTIWIIPRVKCVLSRRLLLKCKHITWRCEYTWIYLCFSVYLFMI